MRAGRTTGWRWAAAGLLLLVLAHSVAHADDASGDASWARGRYMAIFGGGGGSNISALNQSGTALYSDARGGALPGKFTRSPGDPRNRNSRGPGGPWGARGGGWA